MKAQEKTSIHLIDSATFKKAINHKNVQLVDVRTANEYKEYHIENAINIDFYKKDFITKFSNFDKTKPIYIYCRSGGRSGKTAKKLVKAGFKEIYDLNGGILKYDR